jgi:hypothetical protein
VTLDSQIVRIRETDPSARTLTLYDAEGGFVAADKGIGAGDRLSRHAFIHGAKEVRHDYDLHPYER